VLLLCACGKPAPAQTTTPDTADSASQPAAPDAAALIQKALEGPHRAEGTAARDRYRHPAETLAFFGLEPGMTVLELWPGAGWYTEVLAPVLKDQGKLIVTGYDKNSKNEYQSKSAKKFAEFLAANAELYGGVQVRVVDPPDKIDLGPDASVDMVLTFRNSHNWVSGGYEAKVYGEAFRVLKPGGILGVVQHRASEGADAKKAAETGYIPEAYLIETIEKLGFKLVDKSEINANPKDDKDHLNGVWTLPPTLSVVKRKDGKEVEKLSDEERAKREAESKEIGESDRMTLKFEKPG